MSNRQRGAGFSEISHPVIFIYLFLFLHRREEDPNEKYEGELPQGDGFGMEISRGPKGNRNTATDSARNMRKLFTIRPPSKYYKECV